MSIIDRLKFRPMRPVSTPTPEQLKTLLEYDEEKMAEALRLVYDEARRMLGRGLTPIIKGRK